MGAVQHFLDVASKIVGQLGAGTTTVLMGFVIEVIAKLWPTANPQGWFIWADKLLKKAGDLCAQLGLAVKQVGDLLVKLDEVIVALIPQNVKK